MTMADNKTLIQIYQIDIDNLKIGQTFKNKRELSDYLKQPYIPNCSKAMAQLKEWKRYIDWETQGHKIIITKIYNPPLPKVDGRKDNGFKDFPDKNIFQFTREQYNSIGVYAIILNNDIYIGSTTNGFLTIYRQHSNPNNLLPTFKMLRDGAIFKPLWIANDDCTEEMIRQKESEYIKQYSDIKVWNVVNARISTHCTSHKGDVFLNGKKVKPINIKVKNSNDIRYIKIKNKYYKEAVKLLQDKGMI
jgi:hypothetical protein